MSAPPCLHERALGVPERRVLEAVRRGPGGVSGLSGLSGLLGVRFVGKILMTAYVTIAARPTIAVMYTASRMRPMSSSKAAVE